MVHSACLTVDTASLQELLNTGVPISPHEAVAIVQQLLATRSDDARETAGAPDDVVLRADGVVSCRDGVPAVDGLGRLLDTMLPCGNGHRVPGALRFTIARACNSADAPPFESRAALSAALERFEWGNREDVVRDLLLRAAVVPAPPAPVEAARADRRSRAHASDLRRELRNADERLFDLLHASASLPAAETEPLRDDAVSPSRARWAALVVAAVLGSFAAGYAVTELMVEAPAGGSAAAQASKMATRE